MEVRRKEKESEGEGGGGGGLEEGDVEFVMMAV